MSRIARFFFAQRPSIEKFLNSCFTEVYAKSVTATQTIFRFFLKKMQPFPNPLPENRVVLLLRVRAETVTDRKRSTAP